MFKLTLLLFLVISYSSQAQSNLGWDIGVSGVYGKNIETFGPQIRSYILVNEHFCFGPEFGCFNISKPDGPGHTEQIDLFEINLNAHYVFEVGQKMGIYPLAGLNWSKEIEENHSVQDFGINVGAGFHVFAGRWVPYIEYSYLFSDLSDHKILIGTYFIIKDIKKEKKDHH